MGAVAPTLPARQSKIRITHTHTHYHHIIHYQRNGFTNHFYLCVNVRELLCAHFFHSADSPAGSYSVRMAMAAAAAATDGNGIITSEAVKKKQPL